MKFGAPRRIFDLAKVATGAVGAAFTMTSIPLAIMGVVIASTARLLQPAAELPTDPTPPEITFEPAGDLTQPLIVNISVNLRPASVIPVKQECIDISLAGPAVTSSKGWHLNISAPDATPVTAMHESSPSKGEYELWTDKPSDARAYMCWAFRERNPFVHTSGSNSAVALANFSIPTGDPFTPHPDPQVTINSSLRNTPGWAIDAGPSPNWPKSDSKDWYWQTIAGVNELYSLQATPTLRVHDVTEASQEHAHEFLSGILYGVGAAAGVAALQEGLNCWSGEVRRRRAQARSRGMTS